MTRRILFVTARSFPFLGGVETHVYEVSRRMVNLGHSVTVLSTDPSNKTHRERWSDGVRHVTVPAWPRQGGIHFAPALLSEINEADPDVVHVQGYHTLVAPLAMIGALRAGHPYVVTFHSGGHSSRLRHAGRGLQQHVLKPLLTKSVGLVAVSEFEKALFSKRLGLNPDRIVVIPNGAQLPITTESGSNDQSLILSIGRLERYKGHHRVIAALPDILRSRPDARLRILGSGPYKRRLQKLAERLDVSNRVTFGAVDGADREGMARLLGSAAVVALLSEYEAHPVAAMEAVSAEVALVVSDGSGLSELADQGLAYSIPLDATPSEVAVRIVGSMNNPLRPSGIKVPTWDDCTERLLALYQSRLPNWSYSNSNLVGPGMAQEGRS